MSDKPSKNSPDQPADPNLAEPKFLGVPPQGPSPSPGVARHFSQEHDRAAEAGRLGGKPSAEGQQGKSAKKG
jgi:hypothetical protein